MEEIEIFKDILGYEGLYQVSNLGRVKSLERKVRKENSFKTVKEKILTPVINNGGYLRVTLWKQGKQKDFKVHQLVAMAFLGHKPNGHKLVVNHKDFNRKNNNAINLEIITQRKNTNKKHLKSASQYTGVSWHKSSKKWRARIWYNGRLEHLGYFDNELEGFFAYQTRLNEINRLNKAV